MYTPARKKEEDLFWSLSLSVFAFNSFIHQRASFTRELAMCDGTVGCPTTDTDGRPPLLACKTSNNSWQLDPTTLRRATPGCHPWQLKHGLNDGVSKPIGKRPEPSFLFRSSRGIPIPFPFNSPFLPVCYCSHHRRSPVLRNILL